MLHQMNEHLIDTHVYMFVCSNHVILLFANIIKYPIILHFN